MNLKGSSLSLLKGEKLATSQQSYRGAIFHSHKIIDTSLGSQFSLSICFYVTTLRRTKSRAAGRRTGSFLPYSLLLPHLPANLFNKVGFASSQGTDKSLLEQKRKPFFFVFFVVHNFLEQDIKRKDCSTLNATSKDPRTWKYKK